MSGLHSTQAPFAVFRADGGTMIGGGHIVRCGALANALSRAGWHCGLAATAETLRYFDDLSANYTGLVALDGDEPEAMAARWPQGCDLLLVDHYGRDRAFETACRPWARSVLVVDDLADRPHCCDLLLDGTPGRTAAAYDGLAPETCRYLLGAAYLPLRPEFAARRGRVLPREVPDAPWRILLCLGASPGEHVLLGLIDALTVSDLEIALDVVIGAPPQGDALQTRIDAMGGRLHIATDEMAQLIEDADIAIGAAGVGSWERCCLGLPSVALVIAENQEPNARVLAKAGAAQVMPVSCGPAAIIEAITALMTDIEAWRRMSTAAAAMCDGLGLARIVERIDGRWQAKGGAPIHLRPVEPNDAEVILEWQTDPTTRRFARDPEPPKRDEHLAWFAAKRADPRCIFNIITRGEVPAGVVRLDRLDDPDAFEVSILVAPGHRRAGLSRAALYLVRQLVPDAELWAYVKRENSASLDLFREAGYVDTDRSDWYVHHAGEESNIG